MHHTQIIKYDKVIDIPNSMTVLPELLPLSIEMVRSNEWGRTVRARVAVQGS